MFADESGFYFETFPNKKMSQQMHANRKVELCFFNASPEFDKTKQLRIAGEVEFVDDPDIIDKVYEKIKFLEEVAGGPFKQFLEVYKVAHGDAHFWTMMDVGKEDQIEHLTF
jgi:uncharacterized pyridoxamine 5'-phosphate oxidase family protein